jgi:hypothetical protein
LLLNTTKNINTPDKNQLQSEKKQLLSFAIIKKRFAEKIHFIFLAYKIQLKHNNVLRLVKTSVERLVAANKIIVNYVGCC